MGKSLTIIAMLSSHVPRVCRLACLRTLSTESALPRVFFDIEASGENLGRIVMEVSYFFGKYVLGLDAKHCDHVPPYLQSSVVTLRPVRLKTFARFVPARQEIFRTISRCLTRAGVEQ